MASPPTTSFNELWLCLLLQNVLCQSITLFIFLSSLHKEMHQVLTPVSVMYISPSRKEKACSPCTHILLQGLSGEFCPPYCVGHAPLCKSVLGTAILRSKAAAHLTIEMISLHCKFKKPEFLAHFHNVFLVICPHSSRSTNTTMPLTKHQHSRSQMKTSQ